MMIFTARNRDEAFENINNGKWKKRMINKLFEIHDQWNGCIESGIPNPTKLDKHNVFELFELDCDGDHPEFIGYKQMKDQKSTKLAAAFKKLIASVYSEYFDQLRVNLVLEYTRLAHQYVCQATMMAHEQRMESMKRLNEIRDELGMDRIEPHISAEQEAFIDR